MPNPQGENTTPQVPTTPVAEAPFTPTPSFQETPTVVPPPEVQMPPVAPSSTPAPGGPPSIPPELLSTKKTSPILIVSLVLIIIAVLAIGAYIFGTKLMGGKATPTPIPTPQETISDIPTPSPDPMADWKTYMDTAFLYPNKVYSSYSFLYSPDCTRTLATLACKFATGTGTIKVNAGGHGGSPIQTKAIVTGVLKTYPFGEGKLTETQDVKADTVFGTFWITKTDKLTQDPIFGFEFTGIPMSDLAEFDKTLDSMLTTFKFVAISTASPKASPTGSPRASSTPTATPSASPTPTP